MTTLEKAEAAERALSDELDRVVIKSDGQPAYISGDLAYYLSKRERGFNRCIIMLGADHHGYVQRLMAMCAAFDDEPGVNLQIMIGQLVNLMRDGVPVRMSKRAGTVVTMEETPDSGPVSWLPRFVTEPALHARNALSLQRLRHEVERRARPGS